MITSSVPPWSRMTSWIRLGATYSENPLATGRSDGALGSTSSYRSRMDRRAFIASSDRWRMSRAVGSVVSGGVALGAGQEPVGGTMGTGVAVAWAGEAAIWTCSGWKEPMAADTTSMSDRVWPGDSIYRSISVVAHRGSVGVGTPIVTGWVGRIQHCGSSVPPLQRPECELIDRTTFRSHADARLAVFDYIEGWCNPRHRHSAIGYLSPVSFERLHELTQVA